LVEGRRFMRFIQIKYRTIIINAKYQKPKELENRTEAIGGSPSV
jgi:hypothetical protein